MTADTFIEARITELVSDARVQSAAVAILVADGLPACEAVVLVDGAVRVGRDPVGFAEYLVRLREAAQGE